MLTVITVKIGRIELKSVSGLGSNLLSGAGNSAPPHTHTPCPLWIHLPLSSPNHSRLTIFLCYGSPVKLLTL